MARWEPGAVDRLQAAAFELFSERGFERTTVAEIAHRAGLTQRTFFNHFADKREVLFGLSSQLQEEIVAGVSAAAELSPPLDAVVDALAAAYAATFEDQRAAVRHRREIIDASPELGERELGKRAALIDAVAHALQEGGVDPVTARLAASSGLLVEQIAMQQWTQPAEIRSLPELFAGAVDSLRTLAA